MLAHAGPDEAGGPAVTLLARFRIPLEPWVSRTVQPTRASLWLRPPARQEPLGG